MEIHTCILRFTKSRLNPAASSPDFPVFFPSCKFTCVTHLVDVAQREK